MRADDCNPFPSDTRYKVRYISNLLARVVAMWHDQAADIKPDLVDVLNKSLAKSKLLFENVFHMSLELLTSSAVMSQIATVSAPSRGTLFLLPLLPPLNRDVIIIGTLFFRRLHCAIVTLFLGFLVLLATSAIVAFSVAIAAVYGSTP